jgi:50S ribosomal subunit-associated GTPase HflX
VLNKADLVSPAEAAAWARRYSGVAVSAARREGLAELVTAAEERLGRTRPLLASRP